MVNMTSLHYRDNALVPIRKPPKQSFWCRIGWHRKLGYYANNSWHKKTICVDIQDLHNLTSANKYEDYRSYPVTYYGCIRKGCDYYRVQNICVVFCDRCSRITHAIPYEFALLLRDKHGKFDF